MKRAIAVVVGTILMGLMISACATTSSGPPVVTINTTDRGKIQSAIIDEFKKLEFRVVSRNNDSLVLEGRRLGFTGRDLMDAIFNMVTTTDGATAITIKAYSKSDASFNRQAYTGDITYSITGTEVLKILNRVKVQLESP